MIDIIICSLPTMLVDRLPGAPALLKAAVVEAGYTAKAVDLNVEFFINQCNSDLNTHNLLSCIFNSNETPSDEAILAGTEWVDNSIKTLREINPKIIGLSVFSYQQHRAAYMLATAIRKELPDVKIVLGGYGLSKISNSFMNFPNIKKIHLLNPFNQFMIDHGVCDYAVFDDPFNKLIDILEVEVGPTTSDKIIYEEGKILYNTPVPDYDDYDINKYNWNREPIIPITGSKGCVRNCTFCDVPNQFGRFKFRSGKDIADEIITLHKKYGVTTFEFTDSLVNGANKAFLEWITVLADYNDGQEIDKKIHWNGQYICKPQKTQPKGIYEIMARSGVINLVIGVESGSDEILAAMKKQMTVKDVFDELVQFQKHKIQITMLMLSSFYNETWERYLETLRFIINCYPYVHNDSEYSGIDGKPQTIWTINMSAPLWIYDSIPLYDQAHELGIIVDSYDPSNWRLVDDPDMDFVERCRRRLITQLVLDKLEIGQPSIALTFLQMTMNHLKEYEKTLEKKYNDTI
jgi:radical SAM superfamily enzyme YgiQ (UPF0313 family)